MAKYQGQTDTVIKVQLPSSLSNVAWNPRTARVGSSVGLEVCTELVGNNSELRIELTDKSGKSHGSFTDRISGNRFWAQIKVPQNAKDELYATVKLPKHGLSMKSSPLILTPPIQITNLKWGQKEARRGDIVKLTADIKGVPDGTEAKIEIWEHDADGSHDFITTFNSLIKNSKVEVEWEYQYHEDTDDIPTEQELQKYGNHYNPPEYFFRVKVGQVFAESGLLLFKDRFTLLVCDSYGYPADQRDVELTFPDGATQVAKTDENGMISLNDVKPGKVLMKLQKRR